MAAAITHGLWQGIVRLPRPRPPPFYVDTLGPVDPPWQAIKEWVADDKPDADCFDQAQQPSKNYPAEFGQRSHWKPEEVTLDDGRILVLEES